MNKILIVGLTSGVGGVENFICNLFKYIDKNKFTVDFLVHQEINEKYSDVIEGNGGKIYRIPGIKDGVIRYLNGIIKFFKYNENYDIVHINECSAGFFIYAFPCIFIKRTKLIIHSHNGSCDRKFIHYLFRIFQNRFLDEQWACSEIAAKWMFGDRNINKLGYKIINNGIDLNIYKFDNEIRKQYRTEFNIEDKLVFGSIARFEYQKNHEFILKIFYQFQQNNPNSLLILVGAGTNEEKIKSLVKKYGIEEKVLFLGIRSDVNKILQMMDIFLLPSHYEGLPFVAIEAQATGLPIIASTNVSKEMNITDLVYNVSLESPTSEWINLMEKLSCFKTEDRANAKYHRLISEKGYSIEKSINIIENYYENLINNK